MKTIFLSLVMTLFLSGCSTKEFKRDEMFAQLNQNAEVTDRDIDSVLKLKPQLPRPFTLGVYFSSPRNAEYRYSDTRWNWTPQEQEQVTASLQPLKDKHIVKEILFIPQSMVEAKDLKSVRMAAARHGADAVLVIKGIADADSSINNWGATYALLLPALFVPGTDTKSLFISNASLWDVRNEYLYLTAEADAENNKTSPAAFSDKDKSVEEAKTASVAQLSEKLKDLSERFDRAKAAE